MANVNRRINPRRVIIWREDRINYIVQGLCKYYKVDKYELFKKHNGKEKANRKRIAIKLLKDVADCSFNDIRGIIGVHSISSLSQSYYSVSEDISPNTYGNKELKKVYLDVLDYLNL